MRALIVEDDDSLGPLLKEHLEAVLGKCHLECAVDLVTTRDEAFEHLAAQEYALVSVDGTFPVSRGGEAFSVAGIVIIRNLEKKKFQGHVIFYSARVGDVLALRDNCSLMSFNAWVKAATDSEDTTQLSPGSWAKRCVQLLKQEEKAA